MQSVLEIVPAVMLAKNHGLTDVLSNQIGKIKWVTLGLERYSILGNGLSRGKLVM